MASPPSLPPLCDPVALGRIQVLLVPVQHGSGSAPLSTATYTHWTSLIKRHQVLRGDELRRKSPGPGQAGPSHPRRDNSGSPRDRFFPQYSGGSISRSTQNQHVHLAFPSHPPARHLYPLSLLRISAFPLVVIGIAVTPEQESGEQNVKGYHIPEEEETGDIGESSTPVVSQQNGLGTRESHSSGSLLVAFHDTLTSLFPPTSPYPLVKRLLLVPKDVPQPKSARASPTKAAPAPDARSAALAALEKGKGKGTGGVDEEEVLVAPADGVQSWIAKLVGEVIGEVLEELGEIVTSFESPSGLRTLSATLLPSLTSTFPAHAPGRDTSTPTLDPARRSTATPSVTIDSLSAGSSVTRALTPGGRPVSVQPASLPPVPTAITSVPTSSTPPIVASSNPFRRSTAITSPFSRTSSAASTTSSLSSPVNQSINNSTKYTSAPLAGLAGGRLLQLLGDMYLLAGLYGDAIKCFDDGAERCRSVGDVLWEAAAREGRAVAGIGEAWEGRDGSNVTQPFTNAPIPNELQSHFLSALAALSRAPLPYPPTILSPSPQAVSGTLSFAAPASSHHPGLGTGEGLLAFLHTSLSLRLAHFLLVIWSAGGWGSIALSCLMGHTLARSFPALLEDEESARSGLRRRRRRELHQLSAISELSRNAIFAHAESAIAPYHQAMTKAERIHLHVSVVWLARWLGLGRQEAFATREVVKRVAGMIVDGREETRRLAKAKTKAPAPIPINGGGLTPYDDSSVVGLGLGIAVAAKSQVAVRRKESTEGNQSVIKLIEKNLFILGIDLLPPLSGPGSSSLAGKEYSALGREGDKSSFGWPELQVESLKEGIAIAESLPDHLNIIRLSLSALHHMYPYLTPASQVGLSKMYHSSLSVVRRRGVEIGQIPWWIPGKVVLSIEVATLPANRIPRQHSRSEIVSSKKDFYLHNPKSKVAEGKTVIVANEQIDVFVTVQNPLAFDLDVADLSLITSGVPLVTSPLPLIVPANSVQTVRVSALASTPGILQIRGAQLRLHDSSSTQVLLPVVDEADKRKSDKRRSKLLGESSKTKRIGLEARFHSTTPEAEKGDGGEDQQSWLECLVVEEQPLVWIKKNSLTHGTIMLYHGESSTIRLTLENSAQTPVDFIKLSFDDSTAREAQLIISEGDLTPEQAYELDYDQLRRPALTWANPSDTVISPGGRQTLTVNCFGKVGAMDGTIRIDYGYVNRGGGGEGSNQFYTRQITFPILFTVYHTLEPHALGIIRLEGGSTTTSSQETQDGDVMPTIKRQGSFAASGENDLRELLAAASGQKDICLLSLGVRNVYGMPFEVTLRRVDQDQTQNQVDGQVSGSSTSISRLVPPGATERILLPLPRLSLPESSLSLPIPSLAERQYIVDKEKKIPEQIEREREMFWYREALLAMVEATWIEPGSLRKGTLSLRGQQLNAGLLEVLKKDELEVEIVVPDQVIMGEFVDIAIKVNSRLDLTSDTRLLVQLEPVSPNSHTPTALKNVLIDGSLSRTLILQSLSSHPAEVTITALFLACGSYAFRAAVSEEKENLGGKVWFSPSIKVQVGE